MQDVEMISSLSEKGIDTAKGLIKWFSTPGEEARNFLLELIQNNTELTDKEKVNLIFHSRKVLRECTNRRSVYEEAQKLFNEDVKEDIIDEDWLHFFFDKAEKVSNKSMQMLWARMLADEFNKPGSISRKLMHIISIMDSSSARSFQTFCLYVFESYGLFSPKYDTKSVLIPKGFYTDSFDFLLKVEEWLQNAKYDNYKNLSLDLTMNTGELNSLENLGLIQQVSESICEIPLIYRINNSKYVYLYPQDGSGFPLGAYSLTTEGKQLYDIINIDGNRACLEIIFQYLNQCNVKYKTEYMEG